MNNKKLGKFGENIAANFLRLKDYKILDRNFQTKAGEIDLICSKNGQIVFVEVKTRTSTLFGYPEEAITEAKLEKIVEVGQIYLETNRLKRSWRIEAVSILINKKKKSLGIKHLTNI